MLRITSQAKDGRIIQYPIVTTRDVENLLVSLGLDHGRIQPITGGWAYWTFEVELDDHGEQVEYFKPGESRNPGWIFRFPRNRVVAENLQKEQAVLPVVASQVAFAVPRFEHTGYWNGRPCAGYRRIPGRPLSDRPFAGRELSGATADSIAAALSSLHDIPTSLVAEACAVEPTVDTWRRRYHALGETVRARVSPLLESRVIGAVAHTLDAVDRVFERFLEEELATLKDVALIHCDLGCEHILIGEDGTTVTGLIDFEDVTIGDPTIDFVGIFVTYGMEAVERVRDGYTRRRTLDEHFEHRLRFYTWMASCHQILYGLEEEKPDLVKDGVEGLRKRLGN